MLPKPLTLMYEALLTFLEYSISATVTSNTTVLVVENFDARAVNGVEWSTDQRGRAFSNMIVILGLQILNTSFSLALLDLR